MTGNLPTSVAVQAIEINEAKIMNKSFQKSSDLSNLSLQMFATPRRIKKVIYYDKTKVATKHTA